MASAPSLSEVFSQTYILFQEQLRHELEREGLLGKIVPGNGPVLFALLREDDRRISAIGDSLGLARSTMTSVVARLERQGYVSTRRDPEDGRAKRVRLTRRGRALRPKLSRIAARMDSLLAGKLGAPARMQLTRTLVAIRARLIESQRDA